MEDILNERGYFWWADTAIPPGSFAPDTAITGTLEISSEGSIRLELDSALPRKRASDTIFSTVFGSRETTRSIAGILKGSDRYVHLSQVIGNGGRFSSRGPSFEGFLALNCLVGQTPFARAKAGPTFKRIEMSLDGYEAWLGLENIEQQSDGVNLSLHYRRPEPQSYDVANGSIQIEFGIRRSRSAKRGNALDLKERASLVYNLRQAISIADLKNAVSRVEDLLILLTNSERALDWPQVNMPGRRGSATFYYSRLKRSQADVRWQDCWTTFSQLGDAFGSIFDAWLRKHEAFGPGFHLYLGNRRGTSLYPEHKFVNLVWGLETLHRKLASPSRQQNVQAKVDRILGQVEGAKDRRWLAARLKGATEPTLEARLKETFLSLPFSFKGSGMSLFCERCAKRRNDISHFGGMREPGGYREFLLDLEKLSAVLDLLYHAKILQEIGVPKERLTWWFTEGYDSYQIKRTFEAVGLSYTAAE